MDETLLAYIAGVIDADGSITIAVTTPSRNGSTLRYSEKVSLAQVNPQAIDLLREHFGGGLSIQKRRGISRRPLYRWQIGCRKAAKFLEQILPFLRIKRQQAEICLNLHKIKQRGRIANTDLTAPRIRTRKPLVEAEMRSLVKEIRALNNSSRGMADVLSH